MSIKVVEKCKFGFKGLNHRLIKSTIWYNEYSVEYLDGIDGYTYRIWKWRRISIRLEEFLINVFKRILSKTFRRHKTHVTIRGSRRKDN